jgi:hypothetical protein
MLILVFMFNTHVIYYFYVDHYNISSNDTQLIILCNLNVYSFYTYDILIFVLKYDKNSLNTNVHYVIGPSLNAFN